ncbi:MAG: outer membrane lipoprotein-sorting protein [Pseudomonadota bacterium]
MSMSDRSSLHKVLFIAASVLSGWIFTTGATADSAAVEGEVDVRALVMGAVDQTRGLSSYAQMTMHIKRPKWERTSSLIAWTRGRDDSLIRFTAPARDAGNALLKQGNKMWTFNPKLNRSIRLPNSMMSQSWAGSDFSYNDLSRSDKWLRHYELSLVSAEQRDGHAVYTIDAIPLEDAPVVWGKEQLVIRDDLVLMAMSYFDQEMVPVKKMVSTEIGTLGGRVMAITMKMQDLEKPDQYTEVRYDDMSFDVTLEDRLFTVFSLQSGRDR